MRLWLGFWWRSMKAVALWSKSVLDHVLYAASFVALFGIAVVLSPRWLPSGTTERVSLAAVVAMGLLCHGAYLTWKADTAELRASGPSPAQRRRLAALQDAANQAQMLAARAPETFVSETPGFRQDVASWVRATTEVLEPWPALRRQFAEDLSPSVIGAGAELRHRARVLDAIVDQLRREGP